MSQSLMTPSLLKIGLLCILYGLLTNCMAASNWLSGPTQFQNSRSDLSHHLDPIQIGVTTKQEIVGNFGNPTDRQIQSIDVTQFESLSYSTTETAIQPYQYIPLLGAIAFSGPIQSQTPSAAISFTPEGKVSGLTFSTVNAYGDIRSSEIFPMGDASTTFYGMRNPDVSHTPADSTRQNP